MKTTLRLYADTLSRYLRPHRGRTLLLAGVLLAGIGLQLVNPQIVRGFIDAAQAQAEVRQLIFGALAFLGVGMLVQFAKVVGTYLSTDLGFRATNALRADLAAHCLALDMPFHNERTAGEMIERIDGDVTALSNFFSQFVIHILGSGLMIAGVLAFLFWEDWRIGLAVTLFAGLSLYALLSLRDVAVADSTAEREVSASLFGFLEERVAALDDIRANGLGGYTMRRFYEELRAYFHTSLRAWIARSTVWRATIGLFGLAEVLALALGALLYRQGAITIGTVLLLYQYMVMLFDPLERIAHQIQDLQKAAAGLQRTQELLALRSSIADGERECQAIGALPVSFEGVRFGYGDGEPVLRDVSFQLASGRVLGLLGRTGSGKTTLTRLLFRLYDPDEGEVRVGGQALGELRLDSLRERICMVTQDVQLFRASVRDNLTFFDHTVPDERIEAVLRDLGMGEWFDGLPQGLDTELAARGSDLSAGQAQLLAFARAFLRDPDLVVLDEPSSRLDPATEHLLERAMDRLLAGRTGIIIAHRLSTVQRVDEIMIMEAGRIREHGDRAALASDPGSRFHELLMTGLEEAIA